MNEPTNHPPSADASADNSAPQRADTAGADSAESSGTPGPDSAESSEITRLTIVRVHLPADAYTRVAPTIVWSPELTPEAHMIIVRLLSCAQSGRVYDIHRDVMRRWLADGDPNKKHVSLGTLKKVIRNAKACGFLKSTTENRLSDGKLVTHWYVTEDPWNFAEHLPFPAPAADGSPGDGPVGESARGSKNDPRVTMLTPGSESCPRGSKNDPRAEALDKDDRAGGRARDHGHGHGYGNHGVSPCGEEHGQQRSRHGGGGKRKKRGDREIKRNAVGGTPVADIPAMDVLTDLRKVMSLYDFERHRGSLEAGTDSRGNRIEAVTPRQFVACAVRAVAFGADPRALFASLINRRGRKSADEAPWSYITDEQWAEADRRLRRIMEVRRSENAAASIESIERLAARLGRDAFHMARSAGLVQTRSEWDQKRSGGATQ